MNIPQIFEGITSFLFDPSCQKRSPCMQTTAWVATIALGVVTLGIAHLTWKWCVKVKTNDNDEQKPGEIFKNSIPNQQPTAESIAKELVSSRNDLWKGDLSDFYQSLSDKCVEKGTTFDEVVNDDEAFKVLFKSQRLRWAILLHAKQTNNSDLDKKHLIHVARIIYDDVDKIWNHTKDKGFEIFAIAIVQIINAELRSPKEFITNPDVQTIFKENKKLLLFMLIFQTMKKCTSKIETSSELDNKDFDKLRKQEAINVGKQCKEQGFGLVTALELDRSMLDNENEFLKKLNKIKFQNHPDKNGDELIFQKAHQLAEIINNGNFAYYEAAYKD